MSASHTHHKSFWDEWGGAILFFGFILVLVMFFNWGAITSFFQGGTKVATSCEDVTSYDRNWNNDMLCTRPNGTTFYTNYEGARNAQAAGVQTTREQQPVLNVVDTTTSTEEKNTSSITCEDVTTYDRNWDNDMYCTRSDGTTFYTDYAGAKEAESN